MEHYYNSIKAGIRTYDHSVSELVFSYRFWLWFKLGRLLAGSGQGFVV